MDLILKQSSKVLYGKMKSCRKNENRNENLVNYGWHIHWNENPHFQLNVGIQILFYQLSIKLPYYPLCF